jgi:hypothetical protein
VQFIVFGGELVKGQRDNKKERGRGEMMRRKEAEKGGAGHCFSIQLGQNETGK